MATNESVDDTTTPPDAAPATVAAAPVVAQQPAPPVAPVKRAPKLVAAPAAAVPDASAPVETVPVEAVPVVMEPITASSDPETRVLAETTPEDHPVREVIVVDAPVQPKKRSNRLAGIGFALLASIVFTGFFALSVFIIGLVSNGAPSISFLFSPTFYWPTVLFFLALVIVIAAVNTAGWWTYIITSVIVGAGVYFGTAGVLLVVAGVLTMTQQEANAVYFSALANPITIAAGLIAREVAIWTGAILGRRGRKVRLRNVEAREVYEREQAELTPTA